MADFNIIKVVYYALCQSIFTYCILSWGGAAKSHLIKLEVAQRAILKVTTFRPYLFPSEDLYRSCGILSIRQLFILQIILKQHSSVKYQPPRLVNKRLNYIVCKSKFFNTKFSKRFACFLGSFLYNKCNKNLNIYPLNKYRCKKAVYEWLSKLNYEETERLLHIVM